MKKRYLIGGCLLAGLGCLALPIMTMLLVILLLLGVISPGITPTTPGTNQNTNAVQTFHFTGQQNTAVVDAARMLVQTLYPCGDGGYYKCYTAAFPGTVLQYLDDACGNPHCPEAQNGNFQCVFFVLAVYYLAGQPLPFGPDAVKFWGVYQNAPGWLEIPANGAPEPGDIAVFSGPLSGPFANPFGHVAIVIDVANPANNGTGGYIQEASANSLKAVDNLPLTQTNLGSDHAVFQVTAWPGYTLLGYIRNAVNG